tara:strand:+ start:1041 stop:1547 length:507 start_codon:yes stop_codon:yes gene_type:complete
MKNVRYIAYRDDENNGYNDSDFYFMILDTLDNKIIKHVHSSTRCGGFVDFKHDYLDLTKDERRFEIEAKAVEVAKTQVLDRISNYDVEVGDIVKVTNPRVRSFKEETFKVESTRDFKKYGRVISTTLFGENVHSDQIKTGETNVTVLRHNDKKLESAAFRLSVGLSLR